MQRRYPTLAQILGLDWADLYPTLAAVLTARMSQDEALQALDISRDDAGNPEKLKKAYRQASMKNHPDRGGSEEMMKKVNEAFELLEQGVPGSGGRFDWEKSRKEYRELALIIRKDLEGKLNSQAFVDYLSKITGQALIATYSIWPDPENEYQMYNPSFVTVSAKFANADGSMYFSFSATAHLTEIKHGMGLTGKDVDYEISTNTDAYFNRRKQKIASERWKKEQAKSVLSEPQILFPEAKILKLLNRKKPTKFTRKDMERGLISELGAKINSDRQSAWIYIPVGDGLLFVLTRSVFMGTAAYNTAGLYSKPNVRVKAAPHVYLPEEDKTLDFLKELKKRCEAVSTPEEKDAIIQEMLTKKKQEGGK